MSQVPGTRLGSYEVVSTLGVGGMGEVYQARDTKLNRTVALKILPAAFANDSDRLARFRREAQVLASLNHPNVAALYGLEDSPSTSPGQAGHLALVMELVPGRTLAESIATPMSLADALPIVRQIAAALEAAHEKGIVHRDLKPANVKVTDDGTVKVLDFGLAKALDANVSSATAGAPGTRHDATAATMTSPAMTEMGMILGTAGYMAPEQAKGKTVDRRADLWALGVVLFEMLSGKSLYRGETVTETIAHVITQPPDWSLLPASTAANVRRLLRRLLEKDPKNRMQSAGDVRIEIDEILASPADTGAASDVSSTVPPRTPAWRRGLPWAISVALLIALGVALRPRPVEPLRPMRVDFQVVRTNETLDVDIDLDGAAVVLSPDGRSLVYAGTTGNLRRLYVRQLDSLEAVPLPGTERAFQPFFSPDGQSIAFLLDGSLVRTPVTGGQPVPITVAAGLRGGTWGPDNTIVYAGDMSAGLSRIPSTGGAPVPLTTLGQNERTHRWPSFLPNGKAVVFMCQLITGAYDDGTIEAVRLDTGERKVLIRGGTFPLYVASGHLLYVRQNTVYAVPFDPVSLAVRGEPKPVLSGVMAAGAGVSAGPGNGGAQISVASNGTAVYLRASLEVESQRLAILDRAGKRVYEYGESKQFRDPRFSPDGKRVAVRVSDSRVDQIHLLDPARDMLTKLTFDGTMSAYPVWSRDGRRLAFASDRSGKGGLDMYLMSVDAGGDVRALTAEHGVRVPTSFSPDDRLLLMSTVDPKTGVHLATVSIADNKETPLSASSGPESLAAFSPDGKWLAYQMTDTNGSQYVFVRSFQGGGFVRQVSDAGGFMPYWTKNGRELVYMIAGRETTNSSIFAVDVGIEGQGLALGKPHKLFDAPIYIPNTVISFDANGDGSRFAVLLNSATDKTKQAAPARTNGVLLVNFFEELKRATR